MNIDAKCFGCGDCLTYCIQGAILISNKTLTAYIDRNKCVECGVCIDSDVCPASAFREDKDELAEFKKLFGRLISKHVHSKKAKKSHGYDVKTNDVTEWLPRDKVVMHLELNRPRGGLKLNDFKQMQLEMQRLGWKSRLGSRSLDAVENGLLDSMSDQQILTCNLDLINP